VRLVRVSGRVLNGVPHGRETSAGCGKAESPDFLPARFCGRSASRGAVCRAVSFICATHLWLVLEVMQCMDHEELSHLSEHMHFRNTDGDRTCTRKGGDAEVRNRCTRYEGDEERKETQANESKVLSFPLLWVLGQIFLVHLEAALNPGR
jgi:hypothetical protein